MCEIRAAPTRGRVNLNSTPVIFGSFVNRCKRNGAFNVQAWKFSRIIILWITRITLRFSILRIFGTKIHILNFKIHSLNIKCWPFVFKLLLCFNAPRWETPLEIQVSLKYSNCLGYSTKLNYFVFARLIWVQFLNSPHISSTFHRAWYLLKRLIVSNMSDIKALQLRPRGSTRASSLIKIFTIN